MKSIATLILFKKKRYKNECIFRNEKEKPNSQNTMRMIKERGAFS